MYLVPWGVLSPGGCLLREISAPGVSVPVVSAPRGGVCLGGVCSQGVSASGGMAFQHALRQTPPSLWTESQMPVKTLPWPNFVAAGNNCVNPIELSINCAPHLVNVHCHSQQFELGQKIYALIVLVILEHQ